MAYYTYMKVLCAASQPLSCPLKYLVRRDDGRAVLVLQHQVALLVVAEADLGEHLEGGRVGRHALLEGLLEHGDAAKLGVLLLLLVALWCLRRSVAQSVSQSVSH